MKKIRRQDSQYKITYYDRVFACCTRVDKVAEGKGDDALGTIHITSHPSADVIVN